ncbi:antigen 5 like allergen Cul n 1-like [Glossina fuscipes]|uniref:Venom allergen-1 n=1 Tax=Glossina fuscipes TaxID=7396 RepID=A0A9C6DIV7_9MUSC|nr:antigen 5 like allergen Cul n 1-like [Glossina fuscipes]KAI9589994.1 hypothetical protein GQX74_008162 [Glossina fuscipes]
MIAIIIFLCFIPIIFALTTINYCSPSLCERGVKHIGCNHDGKFAPTCPANHSIINIDDKMKEIILDLHNEKRNYIAGGSDRIHTPACRMATMQWDNELAYLAELNVKQCKMAHDKCHNTKAFRYSGQNLALLNYVNIDDSERMFSMAVSKWFSESENTPMDYIRAYPAHLKDRTIAHFTVLAIDRNNRVGCAASTYSIPEKFYRAYLIACNYARNNVNGHQVYNICNAAGIKCVTGKNPSYLNLCHSAEPYFINKWI